MSQKRLKKPNEYFTKQTSRIWKKIGDSILIVGTSVEATLLGVDVAKHWIIMTSILTVVGKLLTNLFTDDE